MRARIRDFQPDVEELAAARRAAKAPGEGAAVGGGIGTALGAGVGALTSIPLGFGATAPALIPALAGVGGSLGTAIGGMAGGAAADDAEKLLRAREAARAKKLAGLQEREAAFAELMRR